ncbi:SPOR domain-containing protein [Magnetococcales bacterium HHB-1]
MGLFRRREKSGRYSERDDVLRLAGFPQSGSVQKRGTTSRQRRSYGGAAVTALPGHFQSGFPTRESGREQSLIMKASPNREQQFFLIAGGVILALIVVVVVFNMIWSAEQQESMANNSVTSRPMVKLPAPTAQEKQSTWSIEAVPVSPFLQPKSDIKLGEKSAQPENSSGVAPTFVHRDEETPSLMATTKERENHTEQASAPLVKPPVITASVDEKQTEEIASEPEEATAPMPMLSLPQIMPRRNQASLRTGRSEHKEQNHYRTENTSRDHQETISSLRTESASPVRTAPPVRTPPPARAIRTERENTSSARGPYTSIVPSSYVESVRKKQQNRYASSSTSYTTTVTARAPSYGVNIPKDKGYSVQLGSFSSPGNAASMQKRMAAIQFEGRPLPSYQKSVTVRGKTYYRVRVGPFAHLEQVRRASALIRQRANISGTVISPGR